LRSTSDNKVFAVGDTGTIIDEGLPKAGVYAVRQGPILWENLHRALDGRQLKKYEPQRSFLKLMNLGDGRAVGQWKGFAFSGRWVMRLKDTIDSGFIDKFQVESMAGDMNGSSEDPMQCRGCGCKLGSDVLESALASESKVKLEDAAEIGGDGPSKLLASTDFFSSPVDDPFLAGRIAALHCASDIIASGAGPTEALANVVLPDGDRFTQQRTLSDFLHGARREFEVMGASVVGGHTIVGPRMEIGFTVIGRPLGQSLVRKQNLKPGDHLYLTKPLGIGVLLAAQMRSMCPASPYTSLLEAMFQPQHPFARIAVDLGIDAGTDITGFGLVGHLIEMLTTSNVAAVISLDNIPILPGTVELVEQGVESSLAPENRKFENQVAVAAAIRKQANYRILFDPQTCGGLLFGVSESVRESFLQATETIGLPKPAHIGRVTERVQSAQPLTIESS
jgi:selenide,water dikinase